jgi:1,4-alpha-glucan branching enzyme
MTGRAPRPPVSGGVYHDFSLLTADDLHLFNEGSHLSLYEKLGSRLVSHDGTGGASFAVWAPSAARVSVIGDFNDWQRGVHQLATRESSGIWEGFIPGVGHGSRYKYFIESRHGGYTVEKADPFAIHAETPPHTASIVWEGHHAWGDGDWMERRKSAHPLREPVSIYEIHLGSWRRVPGEANRPLTYRELAGQLPEYVREVGFTHVEFLPVMEHPFYGSWGYQGTGYFAVTSRYGTPEDFAFLVDQLHQHGIGVILDWVPSHFASDEHGLGFFDGTHLYEHADPRQGFHPDWGSYIFNYGRNEVRSFLLSSAMFWLDRYHADGLRLDAVASMIYLDYSRRAGEWVPNRYGGKENLEALDLLRRLNAEIYARFPGAETIAEESTAWPMVSRPTYVGGLGFGFKWDMGWMHDSLDYMRKDPVHRRYHHNRLTFRGLYAFTENFVLPLSHDEVVHGKGSLIGKMPGDDWQKAANLRLLYAYMWTQPGKKLLFMGGETAQWREWDHEGAPDWDNAEEMPHAGVQRLVADLNRLYAFEPALHELDADPDGFEWVDADDSENSVLTYLRKSTASPDIIVVCNFTPVPRHNYRAGVPRAGIWREVMNTDSEAYGGSGQGNMGDVNSTPIPAHGRGHSLNLTLPPLAALVLRFEGNAVSG